MTTAQPTTALITGATAGIGAEFARQLAARGHDLVIVARDGARLEAFATELRTAHRVAVEVLVADLLEADGLAAVAQRVASTPSPIDYLVNNAGFGLAGDFHENTIDDERRMLDLLATVPLQLCHAALGQMVPRGRGTIVNIASVAAFAPLGTYSAAKAWLLSFSRWANAFYRPDGLTVTAVAPGFVRTEFHERMDVARSSMAPDWLWLNVDRLVRDALRDVDRGRAVSVPTLRYKVIAWLAGGVPMILVTRSARRRRG